MGSCTTYCQQNCSRTCAESCDKDCSRTCSGTCRGGCNGCSGSCSGGCSGCKGCTGTCSGGCSSCTGSCQGSCADSCTGKCNTACTAEAQAEIIAHLGENIAVGKAIRASDYTRLKAAIDLEYTRRGKAAPSAFPTLPQPKGKMLLSTAQKVLEDVYSLDSAAEHDWRNDFQARTVVPPSKWQPVILYLKTLAAEIVR